MTPPAVAAMYDEFAEASIVRDVPLTLLAPSPTNPRKHFDPEKLQELASDVAARGILSPLRVRPRGPVFEIVFGERRFRAAQIATLIAAPCIIGDLSDVEVLELQIAENIQRADMTPIEESDAFARLQDLDPKYREVKALAAQVGKSVTTVRELLRLQSLVPEVREALDAGEITAGHARLIARIDAKSQTAALRECFYPLYSGKPGERELKPLRNFESWFNDNVLLDVDNEETTETFPELAGAVAKVAAAGGAIVRLTTWGAGGATKPKKGEAAILSPSQFREVKAKDACGVTGVYVLGRERGRIAKVCIDHACKTHWPEQNRPKPSASRSGATSGSSETKEQKQKRLAKEAKAQLARDLSKARQDAVEQRAVEAFIEKVTKAESSDLFLRAVVCELLRGDVSIEAFNKRFPVKASYRTTPKDLKAMTGPALQAAIAFCVATQDLANCYDGRWKNAELLPVFGIDLARIDKEVAAEQAAQAKASAATASTAATKKPVAKAKGKKR